MQPPFIFTEKLEEKEKIWAVVSYMILLIVYVVVTLVYIIKSYNDFSSTTADYFLLMDNWRQPAIIDMKAVPSNSSCPSGYSIVISYQWGGSSSGCDCRNADFEKRVKEDWSDFYTGTCSFEQNFYGCNDIHSQPPRNMSKWANGTILCKLTSNDTFIKNAELVDSSGSCKSGYVKCSTSGHFDSDQVFCSSYGKCPINSIVLSKYAPNSDFIESIVYGSNTSGTYSIYWSRTAQTTLPIVDWRVSEEKMCMNNKQNYLSSTHKEYYLVNTPRVHCNELDNRFSVLDSMSERTFFKSNDFENIETLLPGYFLSNSISWNLYYRSYIPFKIECRHLMAGLQDAESQASQLRTSIEKSVIAMEVFMGIFIGVYVFVFFYHYWNQFDGLYKSDFIRLLANYVTRIVCMAVAFSVKKNVSSFANMFDFLKGENCSDDLTNTFFNTMTTELNSTIIRDLNIVSFFNVGLISLDVVLLIFSYYKWKQ